MSAFPRHIAIIMDGNGRWAQQRHLPRVAGHKSGVDAAREVIKRCVEKKIEVLTLFAFSSENWQRPPQEVSYLMDLFITALKREAKKLHKQNIKLSIIGDRNRFDKKLQEKMGEAETLTAQNQGLHLIIAANYGGRWDTTQAMRTIASEIEMGKLSSADISPALIQRYLTLSHVPEPDLLIRTGGELRISNFLLWQIAYAELYFCDTLWPDFNDLELDKALAFFASRERRFGRTSEQLRAEQHA